MNVTHDISTLVEKAKDLARTNSLVQVIASPIDGMDGVTFILPYYTAIHFLDKIPNATEGYRVAQVIQDELLKDPSIAKKVEKEKASKSISIANPVSIWLRVKE